MRQWRVPAAAALTPLQGGGSPEELFTVGACIRPGSGLIGWWQAEGNPNDSAGPYSGMAIGGVTFNGGKVGQAFSFNGTNSSVQIPYSSGMATPAFSVEAWINPSPTPWWQNWVFGQAYGRQLILNGSTNGMTVAFYFVGLDGYPYELQTTNRIPYFQWTHLTVTWDGSQLKLYTNGVIQAANTLQVQGIYDTGCPFSIGGVNNSCGYYGQYFAGQLDEISLYRPGPVRRGDRGDLPGWRCGEMQNIPGLRTLPAQRRLVMEGRWKYLGRVWPKPRHEHTRCYLS